MHAQFQISFCRKRSTEVSNLDPKENNCSSKKFKLTSHGKISNAPKSTSNLSVTLLRSRHSVVGQKRKTTFLSGKAISSSFSRQSSSSLSTKSVSLNHVIFMTGDSQSASQLPDSTCNSHSLLGPIKMSRGPYKDGKSSKNFVPGGSLWSRVCSKNFRT
jgi:hypothetical protein